MNASSGQAFTRLRLGKLPGSDNVTGRFGVTHMIRVAIVNETPLFRQTAAAALEQEEDMVIGQPVDRRAGASAPLTDCDVALVWAEQPDPATLELIEALAEENPDLRLLVIGVQSPAATVLRYIEAGAFGYVAEDDSYADLVEKIRAAYNDEACLSRRIAASLIERVHELAEQTAVLDRVYIYKHRLARLTTREREVLELVGRGYSNRAIGDELVVQTGTVKNHVHNILKKLRVSNRHDAAAFLALAPPDEAPPRPETTMNGG